MICDSSGGHFKVDCGLEKVLVHQNKCALLYPRVHVSPRRFGHFEINYFAHCAHTEAPSVCCTGFHGITQIPVCLCDSSSLYLPSHTLQSKLFSLLSPFAFMLY